MEMKCSASKMLGTSGYCLELHAEFDLFNRNRNHGYVKIDRSLKVTTITVKNNAFMIVDSLKLHCKGLLRIRFYFRKRLEMHKI